ncbi:uncharacterized protein LOC110919364 [Helianthus annuus]|uniref:uncharacterized protein LOC110919364 n=1 Tax=Helianthus annuus TaxID=4232 RepID=UPI000B8F8A5C|nr:uncharacterized protein LOC110919364 [Helianthus annuus]
MNILSLNIRGINGGAKALLVKELRMMNKIGVIALQESKLESVARANLAGFWGNNNFQFSFTASVGLAGGLIWLWDPSFIKVEDTVQNRSFLLIRGTLIGSGTSINLLNVYAPQSTVAKRQLWEEISVLINSYDGQWVLAGDFNVVRSLDERKHSKFKKACAENFNNFIFENGLREYPLQGRRFTCSRDNGRKLNHFSIILEVVDSKFGPRPFRIFSSWIGQPGFEEAVTEAAESFEASGPPDVSLTSKFAHIRARLRIWRDDFLSKEKEKKNLALSELEFLEKEMENRDLTEEEEWVLAENRKIVKDVDFRKNADIKQRSRAKWALDRDENSKFFHALVVFACGDEKAPGPDGMNFRFIKHFWNSFKEDFMKIFDEFYNTGDINLGSGASFIALIPKVKDPVSHSNYRPINLVGVISKVISKVLANRMRTVMDDVISDFQSAFLSGRFILDGPLIVNEIISWFKKKKSKAFILKIDFDKAYDNVSWKFVVSMLHQMGFHNKWCSWIMGVLKSANSSVLVNGSPTYTFRCEKGMRQGDPLSPFLFLVVMEALSCMINNAKEAEVIRGIPTPCNGSNISHLLYADDAIVMGE